MQIKTSNTGKQIIQLSKSEWIQIGEKLCWLKNSQKINSKKIKSLENELNSLLNELIEIRNEELQKSGYFKNNLNKFSQINLEKQPIAFTNTKVKLWEKVIKINPMLIEKAQKIIETIMNLLPDGIDDAIQEKFQNVLNQYNLDLEHVFNIIQHHPAEITMAILSSLIGILFILKNRT